MVLVVSKESSVRGCVVLHIQGGRITITIIATVGDGKKDVTRWLTAAASDAFSWFVDFKSTYVRGMVFVWYNAEYPSVHRVRRI